MEKIFELKLTEKELIELQISFHSEVKAALFKLSQNYSYHNASSEKKHLKFVENLMDKLYGAKEYKETQFVTLTNKFNIGDCVEYRGESYFVGSISMDKGIIYSLVKSWGDNPIDCVPEISLS